MSSPPMTSLQRVLATLGHLEPDRVPVFLLVTMHGARELGVPLSEYFLKPELVAEGQLRMRARYRNDCLYALHYAAIEVEAWGGDVLPNDEGPTTAGAPIIQSPKDIETLTCPSIDECASLQRVLESIRIMKAAVNDEAPIIGVVMSPYSLPIMQMGFDRYLDLMAERQDLFDRLMDINTQFCIAWANAQLEAGATAICYFDPVSSPTIMPADSYRKKGCEVAKRAIACIQGPTATHFASGRCLPIVDDVAKTGTAIIGVSADEDLSILKQSCGTRLSLLGNLNGIEMRHWTPAQAESAVKAAIAAGGPGGGFILSDNHGEIPWQVPEDVLSAISDAVQQWGYYPLEWAQ